MKKPWGGRFSKDTDKLAEKFNASIAFDQRLYKEDIRGSIAHARMLARTGLIGEDEAVAIERGLREILAEIEAGEFEFSERLEDIHMNIEAGLTAKIGQAGARLHTARSRNDQVALDLHMYMKREIVETGQLLLRLQSVIAELAAQHTGTIMPGYTHLQRAQPVTLAHHLMAYFQMLARDFRRLKGVFTGADIMPLGAGAIAGTTLPIDREFVAGELNFAQIYGNSMDAVSDRDYILEFLSFAAILMAHLSRLSEELILWSSAEFSFVELDDAYATGSSMMPQKKNPDIPELVRGKTGRVYGSLLGLLTVLKGLPLTYNKDLQEDKEGLFDTLDTVKFSLEVYSGLLTSMKIKTDNMRRAVARDFSNATDVADYLVRRGLPFRAAHEVVGHAVAYAIEQGKLLTELTLDEYKEFSPLFEKDIFPALSPEYSLKLRSQTGGPAPEETLRQIKLAEGLLADEKDWLAATAAGL